MQSIFFDLACLNYDVMQTLYRLGAKKMVLNGLGQIGCTPYAINRFGNNMSACVDKFNNAVQLFNAKILSLVNRLNNDLADAKIIYVDIYGMLSNLDPALGTCIKQIRFEYKVYFKFSVYHLVYKHLRRVSQITIMYSKYCHNL